MGSKAPLLRTGEFAWSCLTNEGQGSVLASTSKTLWLWTDGGQLFWLADGQSPMHRRCGLLEAGVPKIAPETRYCVNGDELVIGPYDRIGLGDPEVWHAPLPSMAAPRDVIASGVQELIRGISVDDGMGFAELLPRILSTVEPGVSVPQASIEDAALRRAEPLVVGMVRACLDGDPSSMTEMATGLVGLGPGLTPSGDDFLGGLLFALRSWEVAFPEVVTRSGSILIQQYAGRTHLISFTLMDDMAKGNAIAPMHELVNALISGESPEDILCRAMDLIRIGHSTGWDLLTGLLTGLLIGIRAQEG